MSKWYDDIREELGLTILGAACIVSLIFGADEIAGVCVGGVAGYLKGRKLIGENALKLPKPLVDPDGGD